MTMTTTSANGARPSPPTILESTGEVLARIEELDDPIVRSDSSAIAAINRSEVEAQLDAAHRYPRSVKRFMKKAIELATLSQEIAQSCIFGLPRSGKIITGPSVRLAEICASSYGNLHAGTRVVGVEDTVVVAQGVAWDLEANLRIMSETRRRITDKNNNKYNEDMIVMTGNAAASIALRNAIFRVIPGAYISDIYRAVKEVAVGTQLTLVDRRTRCLLGLGKIGITTERILARMNKPSIEDIGLVELEQLVGLGTMIKDNAIKIDEAFPEVAAPSGAVPVDTKGLEAALRQQGAKKEAKAPEPKVAATPKPGAASKPAAHAPIPSAAPAQAKAQEPAPIAACAVCGKPCAGGIETSVGGKPGVRHVGCAPFGVQSEPADAEPPESWRPSDEDDPDKGP